MIPQFNASGVLPPYTGVDSTVATLVSPYRTTTAEFVTQMATSLERRAILRGFLNYRAALRGLGIVDGYHWLNGSFCTDIEKLESRPPNDIDVVTYAHRPAAAQSNAEFMALFLANVALFNPVETKATFKVDAYFTDLNINPLIIVERASYWHGVFGHQRVTSLWKGMVRVELACDDRPSAQLLDDLDQRDAAARAAATVPPVAAGPANA